MRDRKRSWVLGLSGRKQGMTRGWVVLGQKQVLRVWQGRPKSWELGNYESPKHHPTQSPLPEISLSCSQEEGKVEWGELGVHSQSWWRKCVLCARRRNGGPSFPLPTIIPGFVKRLRFSTPLCLLFTSDNSTLLKAPKQCAGNVWTECRRAVIKLAGWKEKFFSFRCMSQRNKKGKKAWKRSLQRELSAIRHWGSNSGTQLL